LQLGQVIIPASKPTISAKAGDLWFVLAVVEEGWCHPLTKAGVNDVFLEEVARAVCEGRLVGFLAVGRLA